jgi:hypothetical protein
MAVQTGMLSAYGEAMHAKVLLGEQLADRDASFGRVYDNARRVPHGLLPAPDANHTVSVQPYTIQLPEIPFNLSDYYLPMLSTQ